MMEFAVIDRICGEGKALRDGEPASSRRHMLVIPHACKLGLIYHIP
jgi:hypothetical protein